MNVETKISKLLKEDYDMYGFSGMGSVEDVPEPEVEYDDTVDEDDISDEITELLESLDDSILDEHQSELKEMILSTLYSVDECSELKPKKKKKLFK